MTEDTATTMTTDPTGKPAKPHDPNKFPRSGLVMVVLLFLVPGGFFLAKGGVEVADRFSGRTTREATLTGVTEHHSYTNKGSVIRHYDVRGSMADGEEFEFDDRRVFEMTQGRTPLPVRVDTSGLTGRVLAVRSDSGGVEGVGGAASIPFAALMLGIGAALCIIPFLLPWQTDARKAAKSEGRSAPPDWSALVLVLTAAVVIVGGTLAWDLLR